MQGLQWVGASPEGEVKSPVSWSSEIIVAYSFLPISGVALLPPELLMQLLVL